MIRQPAVAGSFYPGSKEELENSLDVMLTPAETKSQAMAVVVPHAGYIYSGHVAAEVYRSVELPDTFVILCPNHTGFGSDFDLFPPGEWLTPLGSAEVDAELSQLLLDLFPRAIRDGRAHVREHSLEVQLPFLQHLKGRIRFVPLCIRDYTYEHLEELGHALAEMVQKSDRELLIVSSTDMTHYESQESANRKDRLAIEQMEKVDPKGLYDTVHKNKISMCGYLPTTATLIACKELGATKGTLMKYATSGDVTQDYGSVVGYAGMVIS
jgi:AmmeMemoRadiSam system protein B